VLEEEPTRRLAAILVADVVGFSRMLGEDESGTLALMDDVRQTIVDPAMTLCRGRIFKVTGDGLLAEFPSAVLALRAALHIQSSLASRNASAATSEHLHFRIGVHQGEVVVRGDDLLGDGVNVAARLEPLAQTGGICVSSRIREDAAGKLRVDFEDFGPCQLKNIANPVHVYHVRWPGHAAASAPAEREHASGPMQASTAIAVVSRALHRLNLPDLAGLPASVTIGARPLIIGRTSPPSDLVLPGQEVSRQHCRFELCDGQVLVVDLQSRNGTFVNGHRIRRPTHIADGASLTVGSHQIDYHVLIGGEADLVIQNRPLVA
jgi:class 3 adenylate cyclase